MNNYTVGYIGSQEDAQRFAAYASNSFAVVPIQPQEEITALIEEVISTSVQAVVVDYKLHEEGDGAEVVAQMQEQKENFPLFLLASKEQIAQAEERVDDPNIVYSKRSIHEKEPRLLRRIQLQIQKREEQLKQQEERLLKLMERSHSLSAKEESEVISLNVALESTLDKQHAKELAHFTPSHEGKLKKVLDGLDTMIKEVRV